MRRRSWGAWALLSLAALLPPAHAADTQATDTAEARIARVEHGLSTHIVIKGAPGRRMALAERMAFHRVPAVSIAVIDDGRIAWARAYGVLDATSDRPATTTTPFQAASVSKSVSAVGALRLVERGALSLDGPANAQLTGWQIPDNAFTRDHPVTLRQLLNHAAGLTVHGYDGYAPGAALPTLQQVLDGTAPANAASVRVEAVPGTRWQYSGGGYSVVQLMVAGASRQPFERYMQQAVLAPLGMTHSSFETVLPPALRESAATGHRGDGSAVPGRWHVFPESAAAGLWSTPTDLARLVVDVQQAASGQPGRLLSPATTATMLTRGLGQYGLGFYVEDLGATTSFAHSGGTDGFRAQLYGYTRIGKGAVIMTNSVNGAALIDEILTSIAAEYGWPEFGVVEKTAQPVDAAVASELAGDYRLLDRPARVIAEDGRLYFQCELFGATQLELFAESATTYFTTAQDMSLRFERAGDGRVSGFALIRGASSYPGSRVESR